MEFFYDLLKAFLIGGAFCVIAQLLIDLTRLTPARILVIYVCSGVLLGALGLYAPLRDFAGCGASVPLIGFGGTVAIGVREAINTHGLIGALEGGLTSASAGTSAALCFGYLAAIIFSGKPKRMSKKGMSARPNKNRKNNK